MTVHHTADRDAPQFRSVSFRSALMAHLRSSQITSPYCKLIHSAERTYTSYEPNLLSLNTRAHTPPSHPHPLLRRVSRTTCLTLRITPPFDHCGSAARARKRPTLRPQCRLRRARARAHTGYEPKSRVGTCPADSIRSLGTSRMNVVECLISPCITSMRGSFFPDNVVTSPMYSKTPPPSLLGQPQF